MVCGIPLEQIRVAENLPAIERRVGGELFIDKGCVGGGQNGQAGQRQRNEQDFFHRLIFQLGSAKNRGTVLWLRDQRGGEGRLEFRLQAAIGGTA